MGLICLAAPLTFDAQRQLPELPDEVASEAVVRLLAHQTEARRLIDTARRDQDVVGPQRDFAVVPLAGKADAFGDEPAADAEPAGRRLDIEQAQFRLLRALLDEQHGADDDPLALGDPATLAASVKILDERGGDPRDQRLEGHI